MVPKLPRDSEKIQVRLADGIECLLQACKIVINIRVAEICHQSISLKRAEFKNDQIGSVRAILVSIRVILFDQFDILKVHICII